MKKGEKKSDFGLIGLGVMGQNLARNVASHGYKASVYNRSYDKTKSFLAEFGEEDFSGYKKYRQFVQSIKRPRKIMIMVKAGAPVDYVIADIKPYLQKGDVVIDGGNSFYKDTQRRTVELKKKGIHFVGCGVSGGEEGALKGPSLMPGGSKAAWKTIKPIITKIAAKDFSGGPCVTHVGPDGAGHYVKMVHNGIEYGVMQLMAETYALLRRVYGLSALEISKIFAKYNKGKLDSFLFDIAVPVLAKECEPGKDSSCLIYSILDKASNKGTGKWASIDALDRGVAVPSITQAVYARYISTEKNVRVKLEKKYTHKHTMKKMSQKTFEKLLEDALYAASISIFAQGYDLITKAAAEEKWDIDLVEVSRIWEGGCIIRAKMLKVFRDAYSRNRNKQQHLLLLPAVEKLMKVHASKLRKLVGEATASGIALPGFGSSLFYFESMTEERLPANFIQGLRDYFGAHTYERIDMKGSFHTDWE